MFLPSLDGPAQLWLNDGTGQMTDSGASFGLGNSYGAAVADIDADGDLDVWLGVFGAPDVLLLGDGAGGFVDAGVVFGNWATVVGALSDVDRDGDLDLIGAHYGEQNRIYLRR